MIGYARKMAHAAFGIGMAIGLLLMPGLEPAVHAAGVVQLDPPCVDVTGQPQNVQDFASLQCTVHNTIFDDGTLPGDAFGFDKNMSQPGTYPGTTWDGRPVSMRAVWVVTLDLLNDAPGLHAQGMIAHAVVGELSGPAGSIPISGLCFYPKGLTQDTCFVLLVSSILSTADLDEYAQAARVEAGPRVLDVNTWKSHPLAEVMSAQTMSASGSDLSSLYATGVNTTPTGGVNAACVAAAYAAYNIAVNAARASMEACVLSALVVFALCMTGCAVLSFFTGPIGTVVCAIGCNAYMTTEMLTCAVQEQIALAAARATLQAALAACGVTVPASS